MTLEEIKAELKKLVPDFAHKVAPIYRLLDWKWSPRETTPHIPPVTEIENTLYDLIEGLTEKYVVSGGGGLEAYYSQPGEHEPGCYGLRLTLQEQENFD